MLYISKVGLVLALLFQISSQISFIDFITLSTDDKNQLEKFKILVSDKLPHDYMKKDIYLITWLREVNFNIPAAEEMILSMVQWREQNKMDTILQEDFTFLENEFKAYLEGCDKEGRPILSLPVGDWDVRRAILAGHSEKLRRYTDRLFEATTMKLREMMDEGDNVTQAVLLYDLANISPVVHACPLCIPLYIQMLITFQTRYPGVLHQIVVVNTPQFFLPIWNSYKFLLFHSLTDVLTIYGKNKNEWKQEILNEIDPTQISTQFGGTRRQAMDLHDLLALKTPFRCNDDYSFLFR